MKSSLFIVINKYIFLMKKQWDLIPLILINAILHIINSFSFFYRERMSKRAFFNII
jgi:hypothetical protein